MPLDLFPHDDNQEILDQTRAHTTNPERFYRHITTTLADSVTLEKFHAACHEALNATSEARSLHED